MLVCIIYILVSREKFSPKNVQKVSDKVTFCCILSFCIDRDDDNLMQYFRKLSSLHRWGWPSPQPSLSLSGSFQAIRK